MKKTLSAFLVLGAVAMAPALAFPCTNFLITRGASSDRSTMITYAADSHVLYGELYHAPAARHPEGAMMDVVDWDSGKFLGRIPQVRETWSVVGNMNEHQVAIGETTYGGRGDLKDPKGGIDYGSLMYIALQRAKTAREAIGVMTDLVEKHGYYSSGESFSIADPKEVWIMEMIGKGPDEKGAVWVARRVPDGYVCAHANHARISVFPLDDDDECLYAKDVITFARKKGYFDGKDADFSFTEAYDPLTWAAARICETRVWSMFRRVAPSMDFKVDFVNGKTPKDVELPLWIKPDSKLGVGDVMALMRDHFEDSPLYLGKGIGAGPYELPYRWRPLVWEADGVKYLNDRSTSTQQTGFSFVTQSRKSLPGPIGGVLWFGVDDTASTVYVPMYCGIREVPHNFAVGTGSFTEFTWESAFWVFNFVSNWAYTRYKDMMVEICAVQGELEGGFLARQTDVERVALHLYKKAPELARAYLTEYSGKQAAKVVKRWRDLGQQLFVKYLDGNVRDSQGKVTHPGYPDAWYKRVIRESGDHYKMRKYPGEPEEEGH